MHREAERRRETRRERKRQGPALQPESGDEAEAERNDDPGGRQCCVGAQRVGDSQPAEQRERSACREQQRREPRPAVCAREQAGETGDSGQCIGRRDHEPSPGLIPARLVTSFTPATSATPPSTGGATRTL